MRLRMLLMARLTALRLEAQGRRSVSVHLLANRRCAEREEMRQLRQALPNELSLLYKLPDMMGPIQ
jgi:hypothetical protein